MPDLRGTMPPRGALLTARADLPQVPRDPAGRAPAHRLPQIDRVDPGLDAHREDLGERHPQNRAGAVVHELGDRAGADPANIGRLVAHRVEYGFVAVEDLLGAADPDRHLAAGRAAGAA